jgi:5-methylcytosine-specific restriction endonuclease McrA
MANRRTGIPDKRGSSADRRTRKLWLIATYGLVCVHCKRVLTYATMEADRIVPGGSYKRSNIQPSCRDCNIARGDDTTWTFAG